MSPAVAGSCTTRPPEQCETVATMALVAALEERLMAQAHPEHRALAPGNLAYRLAESPVAQGSARPPRTHQPRENTLYARRANKRIVERLRQIGVNAFGLCCLDGGVVRGTRQPALRIREGGRTKVLHDNHVGSINSVDTIRDPADETSLIGRLSTSEAEHLIPHIGGRARVKLRASAEARLRGVGAVCVADGRAPRPLFSALSGAGTWVR